MRRMGASTLSQQVRDRLLDLERQAKQARSRDSVCAQKVMSKGRAKKDWGHPRTTPLVPVPCEGRSSYPYDVCCWPE